MSTEQDEASPDRRAAAPLEIEQAWRTLTLVNDWIRHAEAKAGAALTSSAAVAVVLYYLVKDQVRPGALLDVVALLAGLGLVGAAACALAALLPRVAALARTKRRDSSRRSEPNLLFFGDVTGVYGVARAQYVDDLSSLVRDGEQLLRAIAEQIHANSDVTQRKLSWTNRAIRCLTAGLLLTAVAAALVASAH